MPPVDEAHADGHGDERDSERRRELQHRSGEKRDPEGSHRRSAVGVAHLRDLLGLRRAAVEGPERRQAAHDVEEVRREQRQRPPARARALLGVAADEPHEDGHERQGEEHEARRDEIDRRDESEHGDRNRQRQHELGEVAGEQRLERIDAGHRGRRDLGALGAVEGGRPVAEPPLDELEPEP